MFLPIKPIIDRRLRKDGTSVITIQYCYSSDKRTLLFTGLAVLPRYWNKRLLRISPELPAEFGNPEQMNLQLQKMIRAAENVVLFAVQKQIEDLVEFLKKVFHSEFESGSLPEKAKQLTQEDAKKKEVNLEFFFQLDDYTKSKSRKVSTGMMRTYNVMKNRLLAFQKWRKQKIGFTSFDFNFYEAFVNYLTYEHMHMRRRLRVKTPSRPFV